VNGIYGTKILTVVLCVGDAVTYIVGVEGLTLGDQMDRA
jgi:hypothetical protein